MSQDLIAEMDNSQASGPPSDGSDDETMDGESSPLDFQPLSQVSSAENRSIQESIGQNNGRLMAKHQNKETNEKCKNEIVIIEARVKQLPKSDIVQEAEELKKFTERQDKYFKAGCVNEHMNADAVCSLALAERTRDLCNRLQTDTKEFNPLQFAQQLKLILDPSISDDQDHSQSQGQNGFVFDRSDWVEFGKKYCRFHRVLPAINYIHGSFESNPDGESPPPKQMKPRVRHKKTALAAQTGATQIDPNTKTTDDSTPQEVELILNTIKRLETKNPVLPYIQVIVNPNSISETVENVFHSAFLVKDGLVGVRVEEEDEMAVINSVDNLDINATQAENSVQSVFSFTMEDVTLWTNKFGIRKPAIKHSKKKKTGEEGEQ